MRLWTRPGFLILSALLLFVALGLSAAYVFGSPRLTLRVTTGPTSTAANRLVAVLANSATSAHPNVVFKFVPVSSLEESSNALETGKVDLAIVRTDVSPPANGQTLAILRRDVVAIVVPAGSPIKDPAQLAGKTIAIHESNVQRHNERALDAILSYFNVQPQSVKRLVLPLSEIGPAIREKRVAAALAVGPIGPGEAQDVVGAIARATKGAPKILEIEQADAIARRFPGFESLDVPDGAFKARPPTPDDTIKGLAVSYRFVVPERMLNVVAGLIGRTIFQLKSKMAAVTSAASQIEAPDTDDKSAILPTHPGVAAYLDTGDQSFFDSLQVYAYAIGIPLSVAGSLLAVFAGWWSSRKLQADERDVYRLLVIADAARAADAAELDALQKELHDRVAGCINVFVREPTAGTIPVSSLAIDHARRAIERRRGELGAPDAGARPSAGPPGP